MSSQPQHLVAALPACSSIMAIPLHDIPVLSIKEDPPISSDPMQHEPDSQTQHPLIIDQTSPALNLEAPEPLESVHFILAATLNVFGVIISRIITKKPDALLTPSLSGLSFHFFFLSLALFIRGGFNPLYDPPVLFISLALLSLLLAVTLATGAYCASAHAGTSKGYASEFVLYLLLGTLLSPLSLYALFHPHRRANLGALLGVSVSLTLVIQLTLYVFLDAPRSLLCARVLVGLAFLGFLGCVLHKLHRDSLTAGQVLTFVCASLLAGPAAWAAALMSRNRQAIAGSVIGACVLLIVVSVLGGAGAWAALPGALLAVVLGALLWVSIDYRRAAHRRRQ